MTFMHQFCRFGSFLTEIPESQEYLTLNFSPTSPSRQRRWKNYGLSADFLGDYFAAFFPGEASETSKINRRDSVKGAVSYIANELLENAMKYSEQGEDLPISITLYLYEKEIIFQVINYSDLNTIERYQHFIQDLLSSDLESFYIQQLERTAMGLNESNMGILTMIHDYAAKFGWEFQVVSHNPSVMRVTVFVCIDM